jgi:hypothetical protein
VVEEDGGMSIIDFDIVAGVPGEEALSMPRPGKDREVSNGRDGQQPLLPVFTAPCSLLQVWVL